MILGIKNLVNFYFVMECKPKVYLLVLKKKECVGILGMRLKWIHKVELNVKSICTNEKRWGAMKIWTKRWNHEKYTFTWVTTTQTWEESSFWTPYNILCWWQWGLHQSGIIAKDSTKSPKFPIYAFHYFLGS